jgi:hypothetical protein
MEKENIKSKVASPPRSVGRSAVLADIVDVEAKGADDHDEFAHPRAVLSKIRAQARKDVNSNTLAKRAAGGLHIYTLDELSKRFGVKVDPNWTQEHIQWLGEVGEFVFPLVKLSKKAREIDKKYIVPGRNEIKQIIASAYDLFIKASESPRKMDIFDQLRGRLASDGVTVHKDAPDASVVIRTVFEEFDSKQAHLYGKSLTYAQVNAVMPEEFADFVTKEGGFEKIRTKALKLAKNIEIEDKAKVEKHNHAQVEKILEFRRTEPLIQLELTMQQHLELKPNVTVTTPDKNMDMVVLLAEMDPYDFEKCNIYGTVPMTTALRKAINTALSEFKIFDAEFATRYYAWLNKQPSEKPKETAKERMNKRAMALVDRVEKKAEAKASSGKASQRK